MLRSRPNRQQRPSSGSGESSSQYGSGNSPMVMSSANDDYDPYGKPSASKQKPQNRGMFGFGTSSGGGAIKKAPNNQYGGGGYGGSSGYGQNNYGAPSNQPNNFNNRNTNNVWDKKSIGSTIKGNKSPATSFPTLIVSICIIVLLALSGMTMHYKRAISRTQHELNIVNKRIKHHERFKHKEEPELAYEDERDEDNEDNNSNNEEDAARELAQLATTLSELQAENSKWKGRNGSLNTDIKSQLSEIEHLKTKQIPGYQTQISKMKEALTNAQNEGKRLKEEFVKAHGKGSGSQIVPGGPGAAVVQKRTLESMESIDDYEEYVDDRENALWDKIDVLVAKLERESRREAIEWFGEGPHTVELEIEYPQYKEELEPADWPRVRGTFRIEMAPLSLMPIAVNLFMQQVHHKLWNGCSFVINAMHILQAGPHRFSNNGKYDANVPELLNRFVNSRLDKMPFQEYNDEFPHDKYTVGFAGRPGGPDFYINKINNSVNHGPGGQTHHDLHEEADPCFGRLVGGMEILSDLGRVPVDYDRGALLLHPVVIVDSRVVATREEKEKKEDGNEQGQGDQQQKNEQGSDGGGFNAPNPGP